ncbi:MAG: hypothetical protein V4556_13625 [Bacteroidota bacterium]
MSTKKLLIGGIVGGIAFFFLGWFIYGNLLMDFMSKNHSLPEPMGVNRPMPLWLYLIIGNLLAGFLIAYIFIKANISTVGSGITVAGTVALLMTGSFDFMMYSLTTLMNLKAVIVDVAASVVMVGIVGGIIGAIYNKMQKQ